MPGMSLNTNLPQNGRVRDGARRKNTMWTKTAEGEFGGGTNFPVRKAIVDYVATY